MTQRRTFLRWTAALAATASGLLVGVPSLRALFSPAFRREATLQWTKLGDAATFPTGVPTKIDFTDTVKDGWVVSRVMRSVWVYTADGQRFIVYNGRCTHLGCGFFYDADTKVFHCPCHEGQFDVETGTRLAGPPPRPLDRLQSKLQDGSLYIAYQDFRAGASESLPV